MTAFLVVVVCVLCALLGLAAGALLVRGARRAEEARPVAVPLPPAPAPVFVPPSVTSPKLHHVMLDGEFLSDGVTPKVVPVNRRTHRIIFEDVAYDHTGQRNGLWTYARAHGQGITRH